MCLTRLMRPPVQPRGPTRPGNRIHKALDDRTLAHPIYRAKVSPHPLSATSNSQPHQFAAATARVSLLDDTMAGSYRRFGRPNHRWDAVT
jgi:hypothetical protein